MNSLATTDPELYQILIQEAERQEGEINLIASENYASHAVMQAVGSVLTNKYAEGYPGKRYYGGCVHVDRAEQHAIDRAKKLFNAEHVNVQPHSGSSANMAVYFTLLNPGDTILGMSLSEGGHLTHGHSANFSGRLFKTVQYGVHKKTEELDYDHIEELALEHKPKLIVAGASAYSRIIDFERFGAIAKKVGAFFMADIAHIAGLVATKLHPNPFPHADFVTSTTHKTLRGPRGGLIMCKADFAQLLDKTIMPGIQGGPLMNSIAAKAVAFKEALEPSFTEYQKNVLENARAMAKRFQEHGYSIVSGGTDNHLFIVDVRSKYLNGRIAEAVLENVGITVSRSCIPFDPEKAWITSGIRIGTPAITTRGMNGACATYIVDLIHEAFMARDDQHALSLVRKRVGELCKQFPIFHEAARVVESAASWRQQTV
jgi:glycine hydroxymethyltransferase